MWQSHWRDRGRKRKNNTESEKLKQTTGEAERSEEQKTVRQSFLGRAP